MEKLATHIFILYLCAFENAKLLTLGNWCKHHCARLIAALHSKTHAVESAPKTWPKEKDLRN